MFPVLLVTEILTLCKINHPFENFNESVIIALFIKQKSNCYDNFSSHLFQTYYR